MRYAKTSLIRPRINNAPLVVANASGSRYRKLCYRSKPMNMQHICVTVVCGRIYTRYRREISAYAITSKLYTINFAVVCGSSPTESEGFGPSTLVERMGRDTRTPLTYNTKTTFFGKNPKERRAE